MLALMPTCPLPPATPVTPLTSVTHGMGWGCLIGLLTAVAALSHIAIANAQQAFTTTTPPPANNDPMRYGPEIWFFIAGVLVTVGINLEQLRRCRSDLQDLRRELADRSNKFNSVDHRLQRIEDTLTFLKQGRRNDRDLLGLPLEEHS